MEQMPHRCICFSQAWCPVSEVVHLTIQAVTLAQRRHPELFLRRHPERSEGPPHFVFAVARSSSLLLLVLLIVWASTSSESLCCELLGQLASVVSLKFVASVLGPKARFIPAWGVAPGCIRHEFEG